MLPNYHGGHKAYQDFAVKEQLGNLVFRLKGHACRKSLTDYMRCLPAQICICRPRREVLCIPLRIFAPLSGMLGKKADHSPVLLQNLSVFKHLFPVFLLWSVLISGSLVCY